MDGIRNIHSEATQKEKCPCFLQFVDVSFESSDMFVSFGILIEDTKNIRGHRDRDFQGRDNTGTMVNGLKVNSYWGESVHSQ